MKEMKRITRLTEEERSLHRVRALEIAYGLSNSRKAVRDINDLIHRVEDSVLEISDLVLKREEEDNFSPSIQCMLDEMIDILDYLKEFKQQH